MSAQPPPSDAAPRLRHVTLATAGLDEERAWWTGALELRATTGPGDGFAVHVGDGILTFVAAPPGGDRGADPVHHVALEVAEDRLVEAARWLEAAAPLIAPADDGEWVVDFPAWAAHSVYAVSPGGHVVELIARHRRPWSPPDGAAGPGLVRGISEIGVVGPDVAALVDRLGALGLDPWFGDPRSGFCAVGDEAGLLICAREWRPWFPTDRAAAPGTVRIVRDDLGLTGPVPLGSACELGPA